MTQEHVKPRLTRRTALRTGAASAAVAAGEVRVIDVPMYRTDALVRRAPSLQKTREGRSGPATY